MNKRLYYLLYIFLCISGIGIYSAFAAYNRTFSSLNLPEASASSISAPEDTTKKSRFPVAKTSIETYEDLYKNSPADLKTPENVRSVFEYDPITQCYVVRTKVGDMEVSTPFMLTPEEYKDYSLRKSIEAYYREKNKENAGKGKDPFDILDMKFNLGPLEKVFGPGGVQIKTQGSAELTMSIKTNKIDNPALALSARKKTYFDFEEQIQADITAKVGDKLNFNMNYNTGATFDFDSQKLNLNYEGKEDEIIKSIEAGNVSMTTGSSLIRGGSALFGIKTKMQFGKLTVTALVSQQESESKTVNSKGGAQTTEFSFSADQYDENRHYFLAHYFRDNYDNSMSKLPYISSGVTINRIEVWVTNKRGNYDQARNIVGFMDLGEQNRNNLANPDLWHTNGSYTCPANNANSLYEYIQTNYPDARNINQVTQVLEPLEAQGFNGGQEYVKVESARLLTSSEYTLNSQLGYISLNSQLNPDEVLAVAFEYTKNGQTYQVGEFSGNITDTDKSLYVKLLKGTTISTSVPAWKLMMKNVYSLNATQIQKEKFRLNIYYKSDTAGTQLTYMPIGNIKNETLLKVMNLDRLDNNQETNPDGFFDFVEGYTILASKGRVFFPVVEPFGSHLKKKIGNIPNVDQYVYQELYDTTLTAARQYADKNKFVIKGEYKASSGAEIQLNATHVPRGSVRVTAGGMTLTENVDYSVDYTMGTVTILNQSYIDSGTPISVSLEDQSLFNMQRKTMVGLDLNYAFSKDFNVGATIMHLGEKSLTEKVNIGDEVLNNTLWGLNTSYNTEFQWLTSLINKIPTVNATAPSRLSLNAEFAQLIPGKGKNNSLSYIDDFESSQSGYDLRTPYSWSLASTPSMFPESKYSNNADYGKNRALISWYYIDRMFTQKNSSLTPAHIKNDLDQLSNHYVREIDVSEVFPNKELGYGESSVLQVLNLSYYPTERGPYNVDADKINNDGSLKFPEQRWGGIMRKMDNTDFEAANIEYLQFWMMDPFLDPDNPGNESQVGYLYFNFGEISEDILKDGMKSFENGLPVDGDESNLTTTVWGKVSKRQSMTYAFENADGAREKQDVGLDGLTNNEEFTFSTYSDFLEKLKQNTTAEAQAKMLEDPFSPLNDPAGDNYHFYRGVDYDDMQLDILSRYKHYNGVEGNSSSPDDAADKYYQSSKSVPDVEDINQDNTLNEYERYYEYGIKISPQNLQVGRNYITDKRTTVVRLRNGQESEVTWYQFKIPLKDDSDDETHIPRKKYGSIQDFKTIRFARMFMTGFEKETHLRFASLELVRGDWRSYSLRLQTGESPNTSLPAEGELDVSVVNIEENAGQTPVNYVLPPGVSRIISPDQSQITQLNEQSLSLKIRDLPPKNARAVYKNTSLDMRNYKYLQMFTHAEKLIDDNTDLRNGETSVFIRFGSDYRNNYYEYEVPLALTPPGTYNTYNSQDQETVWPTQNMINVPLSLVTELKLKRNAAKRRGDEGSSYQDVYSIYDPDHPRNKVSVIGNPSLSDISTIMIGVRNNAGTNKDIVVWVNELRLSGFNESGGWAARANVNLAISDIATVNFGGHIETCGFGGIDQSLNERRLDDYYQYNIATMVDVGRFLPEKLKLKAPIFYSLSEERTLPKYNPLDQDILLSDALDAAGSDAERDSIKNASIDISTVKSFSISGLRFDIQSKNPMPYDPANFTFSYSSNIQNKQDPTILFENTLDRRGNFSYSYTPYVKPLQPFKSLKSRSKHLKVIKDMSINYVPNNISFYTNMSRYYYEQQLRELGEDGTSTQLPISVSKNFLWDRQFSIQWNLLKSLNMSLATMTNARIDEPSGVVNKKLFPDEYKAWKDTVMQSIWHLGTPWNYNQTFNASFDVPLSKIPMLNWMTLSAKYNSTYSWDRGVYIDSETTMGNNLNNQGQFGIDGRFNLETLYNKSDFLKKVNRKFANTSRSSSRSSTQKKRFQRNISLKSDTTTTVKHNLDNKKVKVSAKTKDGIYYSVKYKVVDKNTILIENRDTAQITLTVLPGKRPEDSFWYKAAEYTTRFAMMVRNVNVHYKNSNSMYIPSFLPNVGDMFGQSTATSTLAPGLDFAFGLTDESYIEKIKDRGWLIVNDSLVSPAIMNRTEEFSIDATLEPFKGFKITLNANRTVSNNNQIQFMYDGMPTIRGGSFTMTHVAIASSLKSAKASNGYYSKAFENFLQNREIIAQRLEAKYSQMTYPSAGFISEKGLVGQRYNSENGGVNRNSPDVMIPAFIAAYSGKDAGKIGLTAFPSIRSLLPNWKITYDGLSKIKALKKYFKSIVLSHAYRCTYTVGSFSSFLNWAEAEEKDFGFAKDELTGNPIPSSPYDISSVSINESFAPLLGLDMTFKNSITAKVEYQNSRTLSLNSSAGQIVEYTSQGVTVGAGYTITDFNAIWRGKGGKQGTFNNDLKLRANFSFKRDQSLIRRIEQNFTQATSGTKVMMLNFSADYALSKLITLRAFYDHQINTPLVSSTSYPISDSSFGVSIRLDLAR